MSFEQIMEVAENKILSFQEATANLTSEQIQTEWKYFEEWARRFDDYPPEKRYGILIMDQDPKEENMLYSHDVADLRLKHLKLLGILGTGSPGERQRRFLNWLEKMEGKA